MGSPARQADYLNFTSEFPTDQVIWTASKNEIWNSAFPNTYVYNTGLGSWCLPIAIYSLDGVKWFNQGQFDDTNTYFFPPPSCSDDGVITVSAGQPVATQTLYIRITVLARPDQPKFDNADTGSLISYKSNFNYMKIAASGVIVPNFSSPNVESSTIQDIPHDAGRVPMYRIFARELSANTYFTAVLDPGSRPKISVDAQKLHFDNYMTNPLVQTQASQYYYFIYYD